MNPKTHKDRKKSHKSRKSDLSTEKDTKPDKKTDKKRDSKSHKKRDRSKSPAPKCPTGDDASSSHRPDYGLSSTGACTYPTNITGKIPHPDDGQLSDSTETPEQTEDMTYRETVRPVRSFMGWHHIPTFESDYSEPDKSNNPWKGKQPRKPTRISVAMPPDDWLCQKLECLKTTVHEIFFFFALLYRLCV